MNGISRDTFGIKFFLKDHKVDLPLRVVVNENGTWQKHVSAFLQKALAVLEVGSPLSLRCSDDLIADLQPFHGKQCCLVSMDIKDLYYSLEPKTLLVRVRQFLENNLVRFQAQSGIAVADFLKILELYLQATVVRHDERVFIQKRGKSIGSGVAQFCQRFI
ncbi:unnamed protein product [Ixodes hexagonus]